MPLSTGRAPSRSSTWSAATASRSSQHLRAGERADAGHVQLDDPASRPRRWVHDHPPRLGDGPGERVDGARSQDPRRSGAPPGSARARHRTPRRPSRRRRSRGPRCAAPRARRRRAAPPATARRSSEQRAQRFGPALECALGPCRGLLDVDPVGRDAHEQVGPRTRAQLTVPAWAARRSARPSRSRAAGRSRARRRPEAHWPRPPPGPSHGCGRLMVGAVHPEERPAVGEKRTRTSPSKPAMRCTSALGSSAMPSPLP